MCNNNNDNNNCNKCDNCIMEILQVINVLQSNACPDSCLLSCDRPALGGGTNCVICNTRPIMLYTCAGNGTPFSMPISRSETDTNSSVFRVEKIDDCTATFRVLANNPEPSCCNTMPFIATNSFFTMNLNCVCAIRCLNDTSVDCV